MVLVPRRVGGGPPPQFTSVVHGRALCIADIWGHNPPVPATTVELIDRGPAAVVNPAAAILDTQETERDGSFTVTAAINLDGNPWSLRLTNDFTGESVTQDSDKLLTQPDITAPGGNLMNLVNVDFDLGRIVLPWDPQAPLLARIGERDFRNPWDLARSLRAMLRMPQGAVSLLLEFELSDPGRDRELDAMFRALAASPAVGASGGKGLTDRIAAEVGAALALNPLARRPGDDPFGLALERIAAMPSAEIYRQRRGQRLGDALKRALPAPVTPRTFSDPAPALVAAAVLIYVAGAVAKGHKAAVRLSSLVSMAFAHRHRHYKIIEVTIS
jgi:hypothetical protein